VQPLIEIVRDLLDDLPTSVLLTIHVGEQTRLPQILPRSGPLRATLAENRECWNRAGSTLRHEVGI
jgi:hypothetical protein